MITILALFGCQQEPDPGTFVGNPGVAKLAAAPSRSFQPPTGGGVVQRVATIACDDSPGAELSPASALDFAGWELVGEAVPVPAGEWCGLRLELELDFEVRWVEELPDGGERDVLFRVAPTPLTVEVRGGALTVDDRTELGLQLASAEWLAPLRDSGAEAGEVDVATALPEVYAALIDALAGGSGLYLSREDLSNVQDGAEPGDDAVWAGDDRVTTPPTTEPTTEPTTPVEPPLQLSMLFEVGTESGTGVSVAMSDALVAVAAVDSGEGRVGLYALSPNQAYAGEIGGWIGRSPRVAPTPGGDVAAVWVDEYAGVHRQSTVIDAGQPEVLSPAPAAASPALASTQLGEWYAWREGAALQVVAASEPARVFADDVSFGPALAAGGDALHLAWAEVWFDPLTQSNQQWLQLAVFRPSGDRLVVLDADVGGLAELELAADDRGVIASWTDAGGGHVAVFDAAGTEQYRLVADGRSTHATPMGDWLVVTTATIDTSFVTVHDRASGEALAGPLVHTGAAQVRVAPGRDGASFGWAGVSAEGGWAAWMLVGP